MMNIEVEFEFSNEDAAALEDLLRQEGASEVEEVADEGLVPILGVVIMAVIAVTALSNIVIKLSRLWTCGLVVDARTSTIHTKKNCDLPRGAVLVFTANGTSHQLHEPNEIDIARLMQGFKQMEADG